LKSLRVRTDTIGVTRKHLVIALAVVTGVALELGIEALSGLREAWDSEYYWMMGVPIAAVISVLVGFIAEKRDWLWAAAIIPSQVITMMATSGDLGLDGIIMMPLMALLASVLGAPFVGASFVASKFRPVTAPEAP
jgi:NAD/NADP transhydrogenase beta subunit